MATRKTVTKKVTTELPYNEDAERVVLGCAMLSKDYCLDMLTTLEEEDFFVGKHQLMFRAIASLSARGVDVDVLTVAEELNNLKELENIGGAKRNVQTHLLLQAPYLSIKESFKIILF